MASKRLNGVHPFTFLASIVLGAIFCGCSSAETGTVKTSGNRDTVSPGAAAKSGGERKQVALADSPDHELRGLFVATAFNIDWPSQPGLAPERAQDEIDAIVARAVELNCNAIFLQVRAFGDRIYSDIDPRLVIDDPLSPLPKGVRWAGCVDPSYKYGPGFDPLEVWITKCHQSGLELHAWINPFRIDRPMAKPNDPTRFFACFDGGDGFLYLDASNPDVQQYVLCTVHDLLNRYSGPPVPMTDCAILGESRKAHAQMQVRAAAATATTGGGDDDGDLDGVIIDHYLPPTGGGKDLLKAAAPATAEASKVEPVAQSSKGAPTALTLDNKVSCLPAGTLSARRKQAYDEAKPTMDPGGQLGPNPYDQFIQDLYDTVKSKHRIRFGISPCMAQKKQVGEWMRRPAKVMDYVAPEIYVEEPGQFQTVLNQWIGENTGPNPPMLVPVLYTTRFQTPAKGKKPWDATKIIGEIEEARGFAKGQIHYSYHALRSPIQGGRQDQILGDYLKDNHYANAAAPKWTNSLSNNVPVVTKHGDGILLSLGSVEVRKWLFQVEKDRVWSKVDKLTPKEGSIIPKEKIEGATKVRAWAAEKSGDVSQKTELTL